MGKSLQLLWLGSHAFIDGYSFGLIIDKVRRISSGMAVKPSPTFASLYNDLRRMRMSRQQEGDAFWAQHHELRNESRGHLLLPNLSENSSTDNLCDEIFIDIEPLTDHLYEAATTMTVTPAALFTATWAILLSKYTDSEHVKFGVVLSGRDLPLPNVRDTIGPMINTLPLSLTVNLESSINTFVTSVMERLIELAEFQWTTPENGYSKDYDSALAIQFDTSNASQHSVKAIGTSKIQQATEIPLSIMVEPGNQICISYHCQKYRRVAIERLGSYYHRLLTSLLEKDAKICAVSQDLMPRPCIEKLSAYGNCMSNQTKMNTIHQDLVTLFEQNARDIPGSTAVEKEGCSLTYGDLDQSASTLAIYLSRTIQPGDTVCVHSDRSINWIIAIFGILKAGAVYCSLDSGLPSQLRSTMFTNSRASIFIFPNGSQHIISPALWERTIVLSEMLDQAGSFESTTLSHRQEPQPSSLAYLCFTSGSTGTPKGVRCTHEALVAFQSDLEVRLSAQPGLRVSQVMSPAFDGSIHEIFSALCYGATLVLPTQDDPFGHLMSVDSAILTPSIAHVLDASDYPRLLNVRNP